MPTLVLGHKGMLGSDLIAELESRGQAVVGLDLPEFDLTNPEHLARIAAKEFGDVEWAFNCAAYTAVDKAESERDLAFQVNALGVGYLAQACQMAGVKLMHVSTDFVFDGEKKGAYTEDDPTNPLGAYGESKLAGEIAALSSGAVVIRTAWLYGPHGASFPRTMIRAWRAGKTLRVVADQRGNPTYTSELARVVADLAAKNAYPGVYHAAGPDAMTWHEFALLAIRTYRDEVLGSELAVEIEPIRTEDWPTPARRPANSVLSFAKVSEMGIASMTSTAESLRAFVRRLPPAL